MEEVILIKKAIKGNRQAFEELMNIYFDILCKDDTEGSENGWFVAVNMDEPKIAISMIIEDLNGKSAGSHVVPKVKTIIENYIKN